MSNIQESLEEIRKRWDRLLGRDANEPRRDHDRNGEPKDHRQEQEAVRQ